MSFNCNLAGILGHQSEVARPKETISPNLVQIGLLVERIGAWVNNHDRPMMGLSNALKTVKKVSLSGLKFFRFLKWNYFSKTRKRTLRFEWHIEIS